MGSRGGGTKKYLTIAVLSLVALFLAVFGYSQYTDQSIQEIVQSGELVRETTAEGPGEPNFFVTRIGPGNGADLGGLEGADAHCTALAQAAGLGGEWKAYLSTPEVDARDRIGTGPWYNVNGVMVASDVEALHGDNNVDKETALDENGDAVNGRGDSPNRHDILTGSDLDGTYFDVEGHDACADWTSSSEGSTRVGHHDRVGLEGPGRNPESWNSAHNSRGCSQEDLQGTGGDGLFYCFGVEEK